MNRPPTTSGRADGGDLRLSAFKTTAHCTEGRPCPLEKDAEPQTALNQNCMWIKTKTS
jgi:hypothetical protein